MALTPNKAQVAATVEGLTTRSAGRTLYTNKQQKMTFLPVVFGSTFDEFVAEVTEVFVPRGGGEPSISTKAAIYILVLEGDKPDALPEGWETTLFPAPFARKWMNMLLDVIGDEELPLATIDEDGNLDTDGTVFKMMKSGTGTNTAYSFMPTTAKKVTKKTADAVAAPELTLAEWAEIYSENQLKKAGLQSDTADDNGSEDFEL